MLKNETTPGIGIGIGSPPDLPVAFPVFRDIAFCLLVDLLLGNDAAIWKRRVSFVAVLLSYPSRSIEMYLSRVYYYASSLLH